MNLCESTQLFSNSKYTKWYQSLINGALSRKSKVTGEEHHIIPRSLGGADTSENLVLLTAREHFIAHLLLAKAVIGVESQYKMLKAVKYMMLIGNERFGLSKNSKKYESTKKAIHAQFSESMSKFMKEQHEKFPEKFKKSLESRAKTSVKLQGANNGMFGRVHSEESRRRMGEARIGKFGVFKEGKKKMITCEEIDYFFSEGWIPVPKAIHDGRIDSKYLDQERFMTEFTKWKNSEKVPKSRVER